MIESLRAELERVEKIIEETRIDGIRADCLAEMFSDCADETRYMLAYNKDIRAQVVALCVARAHELLELRADLKRKIAEIES